MRIEIQKTNAFNPLCALKWSAYLLLLLTLIFSSTPIWAAADTKVYDYANLLQLDQIETLEAATKTLAETYQMDIGIVTTSDANGKSAMDYADDFYDENGYGYGNEYDGLLFLIDMEHREIYISTCGQAIRYFTDSRINTMLDNIYEYMKNANYYGACQTFLTDTEAYIKKGIPSNQHSVEGTFQANSSHEPFQSSSGESLNTQSILLSIVVALLSSALIAFIVRAIVKYRYKHPRYTAPETQPDHSSIHYTQKEDHFVTSHTSKVKIETNTGGTSSTHRSSSGRSHGGGGRGF